MHTPSYAPGNAFVGNSTEAVANAFYNWLSPRIWPLIIASNPSSGHGGIVLEPSAAADRPP